MTLGCLGPYQTSVKNLPVKIFLMTKIVTINAAHETYRPYYFNFFKDCLPQISLGPLSSTLSPFVFSFTKFYTNLSQFLDKV